MPRGGGGGRRKIMIGNSTLQNKIVKTKIIKDTVHRFVELPSDFVDTIVDRPLVQRLRRIQQLSQAQLVYPGAVHTRFEHSLGVSHTMREALESIKRNIREQVIPSLNYAMGEGWGRDRFEMDLANAIIEVLEKLARKFEELEGEAVTAALLHDIGHITLSHVGEMALNDKIIQYVGGGKIKIPTVRRHEDVVMKIVDKLKSCSGCTPRYNGDPVNMDIVMEIIYRAYVDSRWMDRCKGVLLVRDQKLDGGYKIASSKGQGKGVFRDPITNEAVCIISRLLSSNIDVDRTDYILRDSIHTGNVSGIYDINRYYSVLTIVPDISSGPKPNTALVNFYIGVLDKGVSVVENMLLSRIYMYTDVYLHDISMIYSAMASRVLALIYILGMYALEDDGGEGRRILDKYPFIEALARIQEVLVNGGLRDIERTLYMTTDDQFYDIVTRISNMRAGDLLGYSHSVFDSHGDEACVALAIFSYGLTSRRHANALLAYNNKTPQLIKRINSENLAIQEIFKKYTRPMIVLNWSKYSPYSTKVSDKVYVFRRKNPLSPVELTEYDMARVARKTYDEVYSKMLIAYPGSAIEDRRLPRMWTSRKGGLLKLLKMDDGFTRWVSSSCGISRGDMDGLIEETREHALNLANELSRLI